MSAGREAEIVSLGMITSVGTSAERTAAAVRAGISRFRESAYLDRRGEAVFLATVPDEDLPPLAASLGDHPAMTERRAQMLRLAAAALEEALSGEPDGARIPLLLALPEVLPGMSPSLDPGETGFLRDLAAQSRVRFDVARSRAIPGGRGAGIAALAEALERLDPRTTPLVLAGGVDSHQDAALLAFLDDDDRLRAAGVHDGFTPGEGAAFVLLGLPGSARRSQRKPRGRLSGVATAEDPGHRYSREPHRGEGLDSAFRPLFARVGRAPEPVSTVLGSLNGERFQAKEWGVGYLRSTEHIAGDARLLHPAEHLGDTGAAAAPILVCLAAIGMERDYLRAPCLVWSSSDTAARGAAIVGPGTAD